MRITAARRRNLGTRAIAALTAALAREDATVWGSLAVVSKLVGDGYATGPRYEYVRKGASSNATLTPLGREVAAALGGKP